MDAKFGDLNYIIMTKPLLNKTIILCKQTLNTPWYTDNIACNLNGTFKGEGGGAGGSELPASRTLHSPFPNPSLAVRASECFSY